MKFAIQAQTGDYWSGFHWGGFNHAKLFPCHWSEVPEFIDDLECEFELMRYIHYFHFERVKETDIRYYLPLEINPAGNPIAQVILIQEDRS